MTEHFIYDTDRFRRELRNDPHCAGEVNFMRSIVKPGMKVMEIGANRGVTAVAIANGIGDAGHLYAFEPVPEYYRKLLANLSLNGVSNVSAFRLAVSNNTGRIRFYKRDGGCSGITPSGNGEMIWVEATTVTEFLVVQQIDRIDILNLDCEGSELLVLQGAKAVLEKQPPHIFCEIHHAYLKELDQSADAVIGFLTRFGYGVRLLKAEDLEAEATINTCSHVYAARPALQ